MTRINEYLEVSGGGDATIRCHCGHELCAATENYKLHALLRVGPVQRAGPWVDPLRVGGDAFVCREFFCPACATLLDVVIAQPHEPILWDVRVEIT